MTDYGGRIVRGLNTITRAPLEDRFRSTVWAVAAHVMLNLCQYRSKGGVTATNSWLRTATGFGDSRCADAVKEATKLGVFTDETKSSFGDYVRGRRQHPQSNELTPERVLSLNGRERYGDTPVSEGTLRGPIPMDTGNATGTLSSPNGLQPGEVPRERCGDQYNSRRELPGWIDEVALADESIQPGVDTSAVGSGERSAYSEPEHVVYVGYGFHPYSDGDVDINEVKRWLKDIQMNAPVWKRPNSTGSANAALGPLGMRLYGYLILNTTPVKPAELAEQANIHVKKVRSLLTHFKNVGMATHSAEGWTVGPVRPSEITYLEPIPGTDGVLGWNRRTADELYGLGTTESFVRPIVHDGQVDITRMVIFTDRGRVKSSPASALTTDIYGMDWASFWQGEIEYSAILT